jgi:fucose permease
MALLAVGMLTTRMLPDAVARPDANSQGPRGADRRSAGPSRWSGGMVLLGAIAFACMLCEGAAADWAAVYLSGPLHAAGLESGLGYASFALAMVAVRLSGNRLLARYRPDRLLPALAALATVGFATGLLIGQPVAAIVGFAFLGAGVASVVPAVFSAAGRIPGLHPGTAVATASACGWAGFVCGPPLIGRLASISSLSTALFVLPALTAFIVAGTSIARALKPEPTSAPVRV